ncbi:hypothetical protein [Pseudoalteromonas sp. MMG005]|uniref:hypothetical protein n=1 Tax=Pseudoalteromonas sp. MMG005 TaxID=2822682 RepID=UPI001B3A3AE7|nr:hypothetical protein [Pseudoalteromonas sp. MMG005]MBQ4847726.1 hypothetical protein [Pseudoalteromonas sp. MMG005]
MKKLIGLVTLLGFVSIANASERFVVNTKIYNDKHLIGAPTLIVDSNETGSISVSELYRFSLTVTPIDDSTVSIVSELELGGKQMSPSLEVELGKEASINMDGKAFSVIVSKAEG